LALRESPQPLSIVRVNLGIREAMLLQLPHCGKSVLIVAVNPRDRIGHDVTLSDTSRSSA
jgi:hypothetical protein